MQSYASKSLTKLGMKLKLVSLESRSSPLSNDAISVSVRYTCDIRAISVSVRKIYAFKTTPLKIATFRPNENELSKRFPRINAALFSLMKCLCGLVLKLAELSLN
jgi:hypothetical protein